MTPSIRVRTARKAAEVALAKRPVYRRTPRPPAEIDAIIAEVRYALTKGDGK